MPYHSSRNEVCTALPAGVASATDGGRDQADVEAAAAGAAQHLADVLDARVVEDVGGVVGVDADLVVVGLVAGGRRPTCRAPSR